MFLTNDTTTRHVHERTQVFLQNDPNLQDITQDFTPNMFSVQGIEVLGTPIGSDTYIMEYVTQNCIKIMEYVDQNCIKITRDTPRTFLVGTTPACRHGLQMPHADGGFGLTPNTITQTSDKVAMDSCFLGLVGSLSPDEQNLLLPNQEVHDPHTWTTPHLLQLKREHEILVDKYGCVV